MPESTANPSISPEVTPPPAPANKGLKLVVIILGVLIIFALMLLVVGLVSRFSAKSGSHAATADKTVTLPPGSEILDSKLQDRRLILHIRGQGGEEIYMIDTENGRLVGRIQPAPPPVR